MQASCVYTFLDQAEKKLLLLPWAWMFVPLFVLTALKPSLIIVSYDANNQSTVIIVIVTSAYSTKFSLD